MEKHTLKKRVLIDYLSVSIDFIDIQKVTKNFYEIIGNLDLFQKLIELLGFEQSFTELPRIQPIRGYTNAYGIGEHIKLLYGGENTKNANQRYTMNLHMSGQACREFENFLGGNWQKLMEFLINKESKFKRLDIAIDDFDGQEIDIYDIEAILRRKHFVSPFRKINYQFTERYSSDAVVSEGFTITLGSAGSNQLQIYDKRLERLAKDEPDLMTDIWYRYEMRFVNEKADAVAQIYTTSVTKNNSRAFMKYARELLLTCLDLKKYNPKNSQVTRWKTLPEWKAFLNAVEKIDLNVKHRVDTTIERKKVWYNRSIKKVNAAFYASFDGYESFHQYVMKNILTGFDKFTEQDIAMINNYREKNGHKKINWEDITEAMKSIQEYLGEDDE
jgi:DNA relaxase NicK